MDELPICLTRWTRDFAPDTRSHCLRSMDRFVQRSGMDPEKFLAYAKTHDPVETLDLIKKTSDGLQGSVGVNFENHLRSFLKHNGVPSLPPSKNSYAPEDWHRGYRLDELKKLLGYLAQKHHKLYAYMAIETGLRAQTILDIRYRHVQQDLNDNIVPVAVRFEPRFYNRSKSAGFTFLGQRSVTLLREMIEQGLVGTKPDSPLVGVTYQTIQFAVNLARRKAGIDPKVQPNHGFRKYFEAALDKAGIDENRKAIIEGHFSGTRAKHYTDRTWDELRPLYLEAYPFLDVESQSPELDKRLMGWEVEKAEIERKQDDRDRRIEELQKIVSSLMATVQKLLDERKK